MPDGDSKSAKLWINGIVALAAVISAGVAVVALCQAKTLNAETAFLQHTQHRISTCIAISQHHYATWERDTVEDDVQLTIDEERTDADGKPILMSKNLERADKAIGLARQLALCSSSDPEETHDCITETVTDEHQWFVYDDNVGKGPQPRKGSHNPVC